MSNDKLSGIKIFGIMNIVFSSFILIVYSLPFLMAVMLGWVTDMEIYGSLHWFCLYIIDRVSLTITFIFLFYLFRSGLLLLRQDIRARKLAIVASSAIVLSEALMFLSAFMEATTYERISLSLLNPYSIALELFLLYFILQIVYFMSPGIKSIFNDEKEKINLTKPIIIIIISLLSPLFVVPILSFILDKIR